MKKQGFERWMILVTWALILQHVHGSGKLEIKFINFRSNGKGSNGNCCEAPLPWGIGCDNQCDPYFILCLDRLGGSNNMGQCPIYRKQTGVFHEQNSITFGSSLAGVANPFIISKASVPNDFNVKVGIYDNDPNNGHDHMEDVIHGVAGLIPTVNGVKGSYTPVHLRKSERATLNIQVRSYCDLYFYGNTCTKKCKDNDGHYTCNRQTGDKICHIGWKGPNCNEDIDECEAGLCEHGANCTNSNGGFKCDCQEDFKGTLCDKPKHECVINPCRNGGTCYGNETTSFTCDCLPWFGGETCQEAVDPCDIGPCHNNATCISNNITTTGYACSCESDWTGAHCDVEWETTTTARTTAAVTFGDPSYITLLGVIDNTNNQELEDGLIRLINELGGVQGRVYIKVIPKIVPIKEGVTTTYVQFHSAGENGAIDNTVIDEIFQTHSDDTINAYLPLPLYRPVGTVDPQKQQQNNSRWVNSNWYVIVLGVLVALILVACLIAFLIVARRRRDKEKSNAFLRCDSNVQEAQPNNMAFENVLYHETHRQRESDLLDDGEVTLNASQNPRAEVQHPPGACADDLNPYMQPVQYDTPVKQPACACNGVSQYQNSNMAALDTRCDAGGNDYTDFNDLDGAKAKEENHYQELDDVIAQKIALSVGLPEDSDVNVSIGDSDDEDDIDEIKASFKEEFSEA